MRFLACLLTLQYSAAQEPLTLAEQPQLQRDVQAVFFSSAHTPRQHLLSVACLHSSQDQLVLRLTLAEEPQGSTLASLLRRVHSGRPVQLCQRRGTIRTCAFSDRVWTGVSTWADFQADSPPASFHFTFVTPLLTASPVSRSQPNALPFPEPEIILAPVWESWHHLSGPSLAGLAGSAQQIVQATRCMLATYRLQTVALPALRSIGYLGWGEYRCFQPQAEAMTALWALVRLAFFTGCGYETIAGFGAIRLVLRERGG